MAETIAPSTSHSHYGHPHISALWNDLNEPLRAFIRSKVADSEEAEDILQDVFLRIHHKIGSLKDQEKLQSWIYQITRNCIIDHYRKRHTAEEFSDETHISDESDEPDMTQKLAASLHETIDELPEPYRRVLILTELQGKSHKQVAEEEGISLSGVKSRVQRARIMLKDLLQECCHFDFDRRGRLIDFYEHCCCCAGKKSNA